MWTCIRGRRYYEPNNGMYLDNREVDKLVKRPSLALFLGGFGLLFAVVDYHFPMIKLYIFQYLQTNEDFRAFQDQVVQIIIQR